MKALLFQGQGSQAKGMGKDLFDEYINYTQKADDILGYSIKDLCLSDPQKLLSKTQYTQTALYVVNSLNYLNEFEQRNDVVNYLAGHSLGEYNALFAAGVFNFETGLRLVKRRGELMSHVSGGGMIVVLNTSQSAIETILLKNDLGSVEIANYNSAKQFVLAGLLDDIKKAKEIFDSANIMCVILNVSSPFHSRHMQSVVEGFENILNEAEFHLPKIPVISNVTARPHRAENIKSYLLRQIISPVRWQDSISYLREIGVVDFIEIGSGKVLTNLMQSI